jgi:hypothetical protein
MEADDDDRRSWPLIPCQSDIFTGRFYLAWPSLLSPLTTKNKRKLMKKLICCTIIASFATIALAIAAPNKEAIMAKEKAAWQAFKDKKADDFKKVVDKDFRGVYAEGVSNLQKELDDMKKWDMKSFAISDYDSFSDEPDVIVTTYTVKLEGTYEGKDMTGTYNCGTVWKTEKGAWMAIFHTNTKQEAAAKPAGTQ